MSTFWSVYIVNNIYKFPNIDTFLDFLYCMQLGYSVLFLTCCSFCLTLFIGLFVSLLTMQLTWNFFFIVLMFQSFGSHFTGSSKKEAWIFFRVLDKFKTIDIRIICSSQNSLGKHLCQMLTYEGSSLKRFPPMTIGLLRISIFSGIDSGQVLLSNGH